VIVSENKRHILYYFSYLLMTCCNYSTGQTKEGHWFTKQQVPQTRYDVR